MKRKFRKLLRDPQRFFFDYFAKRIGAKVGAPTAVGVREHRGEWIVPAGFTFDKTVHPWIQVAKTFELRTGALTGHPDQSLLVNSVHLLDLLKYICWIASGLMCGLRVYTLGGGYFQEVNEKDLLNVKNIEKIYSNLRAKPDFVVEFLAEFDNNFAAHIFQYDLGQDEQIVVRSNRAYVKRVMRNLFDDVYPAVINEFGDYAFGTPWPVDVVYTWVNKDDPEWRDLWNTSFPDTPFDADRYSSRDELKYSLRSICKFLPWFHRVFIVSNCARPIWLSEHPRITWVTHEDIFPDPTVLPTFNSHAIEACLHRIPGLSERFIYFNDDMLVNSPSYYNDFFDCADRTIAYFESYGMVFKNNMFDATKEYLAPALNCQELLRAEFPSYQAIRLHKHTPYALRKSLLIEIERKWCDLVDRTRAAKKRTAEDLNITSFLYHHYAMASGRAVQGDAAYKIVRPKNIGKLSDNVIRTFKFLCFNDGDGSATDSRYARELEKIFRRLHPCKSPFEIPYRSWSKVRISKTIMAYKDRVDRIPYLRKMIGDAGVSLDEGHLGLWENAKQSWLQYEKDAAFHMVVQDDAVVANNFYEKLSNYLREEDNFIYSLFFRFKSERTHGEFNDAARKGWKKGGFSYPRVQWAIGLVVPTKMVKKMIEFSDGLDGVKYKNTDDLRFSRFAESIGVQTFYLLPSLIDHSKEMDSLISHGPNDGRQATWFAEGENGFLKDWNLDLERKVELHE